jgi:endonuclease/exonuclease/phosphatase family metal-dependent hydrolase
MEATLRRVREDLDRDPLPFFILGDFNALPGSAPIALCEDNPYAELTELTAELDYTFHAYGRRKAPYKIDYIFADRATAAKVASVTRWLDESDGIYLSDHYPIAAETAL